MPDEMFPIVTKLVIFTGTQILVRVIDKSMHSLNQKGHRYESARNAKYQYPGFAYLFFALVEVEHGSH